VDKGENMEIKIIIGLLLFIMIEATYLVAVNKKSLLRLKNVKPIFVDTSVLIDGRIIAVAQSGFISGILSIPRSVIGELQFLADHADAEKRSRARHGLDVVTELQHMPGVRVEIFQDGSKAEEGVDERLLNLAKRYNGSICTIDYNLNKVAQVENITVLNVNDLAMSLRMAYLPGEKMLLELTAKGQDSHQAVGHLTDGTMVVVEHASSLIGQSVEIEFIRSLQTAAGKMMFAKLVDSKKTTFELKKPNIRNNPIARVIKNQNQRKDAYKDNRNKQTQNQPQLQPQIQTQFQPQSQSQTQPQPKNSNQKYQRRNKSDQHEQNLMDLVNKQ